MIRFVDLLSAVVGAMGVVSALASLWATRRGGIALAVLLDLLTAASLLRLAADTDFMRAATAGVVLAIRRMVSWSFHHGPTAQWHNRVSLQDIGMWAVREGPSFRRARSQRKRPRGSPPRGH